MRTVVCISIIFCLVTLVSGCRREPDADLVTQIAEMQKPKYNGEEIRPEVVEDIKEAFLLYEENIQDTVKASTQLGRYYKLLAKQYIEIEELKQEIALLKKTENQMIDLASEESDPVFHSILFIEYMSYEMYEHALEQIKFGLKTYPDNAQLHYYAGVCHARIGKSKTDAAEAQERMAHYQDAEASYNRALDQEPNYVAALTALAVLYIFEYGESIKAMPLLERALAVEKNNSEVKFLLARTYYEQGNLDRAIELYESIVAEGKSEAYKQSAEENLIRLNTEKNMTK